MTDIKYHEANIFARGTVPDGYFDDRARVGFALIGQAIYAVADCGMFRTGLSAVDTAEALWLLRNHPSAKRIEITEEVK